MRSTVGDTVLPLAARGAGTHTGVIQAGPTAAADTVLFIHVSAVAGTSPIMTVALEQSTDGSTWTAVVGSTSATITAVGGYTVNAATPQPHVRVTSTVAGTTPSFTYRVFAMCTAD